VAKKTFARFSILVSRVIRLGEFCPLKQFLIWPFFENYTHKKESNTVGYFYSLKSNVYKKSNYGLGHILGNFMTTNLVTVLVSEETAYFCSPGLPDFSCCNMPKWENMYQITTRYAKWRQNTPYM
jgi:hypothetical protein